MIDKNVSEIIIKIAKGMGNGWVFNEIESLKHGYTYYLTNGYYKKILITRHKATYCFDLYIPSNSIHFKHDKILASININIVKRNIHSIINDINKRLLPINLDELILISRSELKEERKKEELKKSILRCLNKMVNLSSDNKNFHFKKRNTIAKFNFRNSLDEIDLNIRLSTEDFIKILSII